MTKKNDPFVWIVRGVDGTDVYHTDPMCTAITARIGWYGNIEKIRKSIASDPLRGRHYGKRQCKRCPK